MVGTTVREIKDGQEDRLLAPAREAIDSYQASLFPHSGQDIQNIRSLIDLKVSRTEARILAEPDPVLQERMLRRLAAAGPRKMAEFAALLALIPAEGTVLDLCCGTGDMALLTALRGQKSFGIERSAAQIEIARELALELGADAQFFTGDIREARLPTAEHWVAKHPCGKDVSVVDEVILRWLEDDTAESLLILNCCQGKARNHPPLHLIESGTFSREQWRELSKRSQSVNESGEERDPRPEVQAERDWRVRQGYRAIFTLNLARMDYITSVYGHHAHIGSVVGPSIQNMYLHARKIR